MTVDQWGTPTRGHASARCAEGGSPDRPQRRRAAHGFGGCPGGYFVVDGSVRIDHVDQGSGDWDSPEVLRSRAVSTDTWRGTVRNTASGRAQAKVFAVHQAADERRRRPQSQPDRFGTGDRDQPGSRRVAMAVLQCGPGQIAVAPGFESSAQATSSTASPRATAGSSASA